jgi:hypothetical protein
MLMKKKIIKKKIEKPATTKQQVKAQTNLLPLDSTNQRLLSDLKESSFHQISSSTQL